MNQKAIAALMAGIAPVIQDHVRSCLEAAVAPFKEQMAALERKLATVEDRRAPANGRDADPEVIARMVDEAVAKIPAAPAGKDADPAVVAALVTDEVAKAVAALPAPANGKDADPELIARMVDEAVAKIPAAPAGKDADPAVVTALVTEQVAKAVAALPAPANGKDADPELIARMVDEAVAKIPAAPAGKDGVGLAGAVIDRDGVLILTLTDGATKSLGCVVGKDADWPAIAARIVEEVAKIPAPVNGKDGFGFDDMVCDYDGERKFTLRFVRGDQVKEFSFDLTVPLDRGVWREGPHKKGDGVTWDGSFFIAQRDTEAKPGASPDWRLAVKRGRDGKEGKPGEKGAPGPRGEPGRDQATVYRDGPRV